MTFQFTNFGCKVCGGCSDNTSSSDKMALAGSDNYNGWKLCDDGHEVCDKILHG